MKNTNQRRLAPAALVVILFYCLAIIPILVPSAKAQGALDAYFTGVAHSSKIYEFTQDTWNFTVYNYNCEVDIWGRAWFFFRFYLDDVLWWDEMVSSSSWQLNKGSSTTRQYYRILGSGPATKNVRIELYWDYQGTPYLEDTTSFSEKIVRLYADSWSPSPSPLSVEKGKINPSTLSVGFKNGGNDYMYSASIAVVDSAGLIISPDVQNLQDIASQGTKSTSFSVTAPSTTALGGHIVSLKVSYSDFTSTPHSESKTLQVTVTKLSTSISLTLQPSTLKRGASTTITAKLIDGNNVALAGKEISFSVESTSIGTASTDSSGNAIKTYTVTIDAGTYAVQASYAGSADYSSSSATSNLLVPKLDTTLIVEAQSATQGRECSLKATLTDEDGTRLQNMDVDFYIFEGNAWNKIGTAKTDSNGIATLNYTPTGTGNFQVKANCSGTSNYAASNSDTANISVTMDYTPYYIGGALIAVGAIVIVGYTIFSRKKKASHPPQQSK